MEFESTRSLNEELADLAVDGLTASQTLSIATLLRRDLEPPKRLEDATALQVLLAHFKLEAVAAVAKLADLDPLQDPQKAAEQRLRFLLYTEHIGMLRRIIEAGEKVWEATEEIDRVAIAREMGLDYEPELDGKGYET